MCSLRSTCSRRACAAPAPHRARLTWTARLSLSVPLHLLPIAAAAPAVLVGAWLLRVAHAPLAVQALQVAVTVAAVAIYVVMTRLRSLRQVIDGGWLHVALAASLFVPLITGSTGSPSRWIVLGNLRLYLAPIVLPLLLFVLGAPRRVIAVDAAVVTGAAIALVLQPDAAQLTALALAMLALLIPSRVARPFRFGLLGMLIVSVVVAWRRPDPLAPVRYVEGVFTLAAESSPWLLTAALVSATLPVAAFAWIARVLRSPGILAVAIYYGVLLALAPLQVTPVPLLGFGAGPVLGYALVAAVVSRASRDIVQSNGPQPASRRPDDSR